MPAARAPLPRIRLARTPSVSELDAIAPPLPVGIRELGALRQWGLCDARKVAVRFDGWHPWGADIRGDVGDVLAAVKAGNEPPRNVLGTYDEARAALLRLRGRPVPLKHWGTGERTDGPIIDGLSLRFVPNSGRRLVGVDFDGVIDERGRLHRACRWLLDELSTFVEVSVSGRGLHAYVWVDDLDDALPDASTAYAIGEGYGRFAPYPSKVPSVAIYDGRSWRHFRWSGVGYGRWAGLPIADASDVIPRWLRDIAMCRQVDAWRRSLEPREPLPAVPAGIGSRLSWATARNAGQVTAALGGRVVYGRFEAPCPWCVRQGRESKSGRMSLVVWDDANGKVGVTCWYCRERGMNAHVWHAVGEAVAHYEGVA